MKEEELFDKISNWAKENLFIIIIFVSSTSFFIFQHFRNLSWDFKAHLMNGIYIFSSGQYFEVYRAPLSPFFLGLFSKFLGPFFAEYSFLLFFTALFFISSYIFARIFDIKPVIFIAILLNIYTLRYGLINSTEMLSLIFLELFVASIIKPDFFKVKGASGLFIGLASLARYTSVIFLPLIIFKGKLKDNLYDIGLFFVSWIPWLIFNLKLFGNSLTSVANSYALNVVFRGYINEQAQIFHFILLSNFLIPVFLFGIPVLIWKYRNKISIVKKKIAFDKLIERVRSYKGEILLGLIFFMTVYQYLNIPVKSYRYLYNAILPLSYFSYKIIEKIQKAYNKEFFLKLTAFIIFILSIFTAFWIYSTPEGYYSNYQIYRESSEVINDLNLSECSLMSNSWVFVSYFGNPAIPPPRKSSLGHYLKQNYTVLIIKETPGPDYFRNSSFIDEFPVMYNSSKFVFLKEQGSCRKQSKVNSSYLFRLNRSISFQHNYSINTNPCYILFSDSVLGKFCNVLNLKPQNYELGEEKD